MERCRNNYNFLYASKKGGKSMKKTYKKPEMLSFGTLESIVLSGTSASSCHTSCPY